MERQMKKLAFFLVVVPGLLSCNGDDVTKNADTTISLTDDATNLTAGSRKTFTLLLIDKTASVSTFSDTSFIKKVEPLIKNNFYAYGSHVRGNFIHANTLGVPSFLDKKLEVADLPKDLKKRPRIEQIRLERRRKNQINEVRNNVLETIQANLNLPSDPTTQKSTDLWASFELMSRFFKNADTNADKVVLYLSDMVESVKAKDRRDFGRKPIKNKEEAQNFAKQDAAWILKNLEVDTNVLKGVSVKILPPSGPLDTNNLQQLRYYWEALFQQMGIQNVEFL